MVFAVLRHNPEESVTGFFRLLQFRDSFGFLMVRSQVSEHYPKDLTKVELLGSSALPGIYALHQWIDRDLAQQKAQRLRL